MSNVKGLLNARSRQNQIEDVAAVEGETSGVLAALQLVGMNDDAFRPTEAQLAETWVMLRLIGVAPIVEEVFE